MKNKKTIEERIYELIGIRYFKKFVMKLRDGIVFILLKTTFKKMSIEEKEEIINNSQNNYNLGRVKDVRDLKRFKKQLLMNASIHIGALIALIPSISDMINGDASLGTSIYASILAALNLYCILLQRYNHIRINRVIRKYEKKEKEEIEEKELSKDLTKTKDYNVELQETITFDDLISNATIDELKECRDAMEQIESLSKTNNINNSYSLEEYQNDQDNSINLKLKNRK